MVRFRAGAVHFFVNPTTTRDHVPFAEMGQIEAPTQTQNFSVTDTCIQPQDSRDGKQSKLSHFAQKKDEWVHICDNFYMEVRQKFFFLWLCVHETLYQY